MSFPKILAITTVILFSVIGVLAVFKGEKKGEAKAPPSLLGAPIELNLKAAKAPEAKSVQVLPSNPPLERHQVSAQVSAKRPSENEVIAPVDRVHELFNKGDPKFPFVETISYKSRVAWQKGRPAWLSDYASYYSTSRHFIARSLNGKPEYFKQDVAEGDRFNVLRKDMNLEFHLLIDTSLCKMWLYCLDADSNQKWLIKIYDVGLGRPDTTKASGLLSPHGKYMLGSKIAIYKPKMQGIHNGQKTEMVRVFGSRWIPFEKEVSGCSAPAKGFGVHGVPWVANAKGDLDQDKSSVGKYESDGCVRLATEDMEELFAIIITKPTTIELVRDYRESEKP